jgi:hypothetical protein
MFDYWKDLEGNKEGGSLDTQQGNPPALASEII